MYVCINSKFVTLHDVKLDYNKTIGVNIMTNVELKYNPYTNETLIRVNEKPLDKAEIAEYVGAGDNISDWAMNFWERISTKCNDDFTVHFCGLESDYMKIAQAFYEFKKSTTDDVNLEPDYIINPIRINDEQYVKNELEIIFGKKFVEQQELKECPECKHMIPEKSVYCSFCGKKQDGTERIDESCLYIEKYLPVKEIDNNVKEKIISLYKLIEETFHIKDTSKDNEQKESGSDNFSLPGAMTFGQLYTIYMSKPGYVVTFGTMPWRVEYNNKNEALLISLNEGQSFNTTKKSGDMIRDLIENINNYLNTNFLETCFSAEERQYIKEPKNGKIFIPTTEDVSQDTLDYLRSSKGNPLFEDGWISSNGSVKSYNEHGWSPYSFVVYAIIVDINSIMKLFENR